MDPLADKLLVTAAFVSLVYLDLAKAWMVTVILGREFFVTVLGASPTPAGTPCRRHRSGR